jgi:hypothetical protein
MNPALYKTLGPLVTLGYYYTPPIIENITWNYNKEMKSFGKYLPFNNNQADIVYFKKFTCKFHWISKRIFNGEHTFYVFEYGDDNIRKLMPELQKELVEYVFHPSRIKNIEQLDDM